MARTSNGLNAPVAVGRAFRAAGTVDPAGVSARAGLVAAIPVTGLLAIGNAVGQPIGAVTVAVGAMLAGVAWRGGGGPAAPPIPTMAAASAALAVATFAGTASGRWPWLHLGILVVFCLVAGSLSALGRRGAVVGTQSVIAFVVFGRFPEALPAAIGLAGLVLLGGATQTAFAACVALPPAWRRQRDGVATAYRQLAEIATGPRRTTVPAAVALDAAEAKLTGPALFADRAVMVLSALIDEGRRIRLELIVLRATVDPSADAEPSADLRIGLERIGAVLRLVADVVAGEDPEVLDRAAAELDAWVAARPLVQEPASEESSRLDARMAALAGQVLGAARVAGRARHRGGRGSRARPTRGSRLPFADVADDLRRIRAAATLQSAAGRHAVRLAVVVAGTELLSQRVDLPRGYWAVVAAATVLRPDFGATFTRGAERVLGTCFGVVIATLIAVALDPSGWVITAVVALLAYATYAVFGASFAAGTAGLTAMIVFLLHAVAPDSTTIALDRGIDTAIGGAIGLAAYALWPTWSGVSAGRLLADVVAAQRHYLEAVLADLVRGEPLDDGRLRPLARRARMNYAEAEAAVTLSHEEPVRGGDPDRAAATLAGLRRLVFAVHALRLEARAVSRCEPSPGLEPLAAGLGEALEHVDRRLRGEGAEPSLPPLRDLYRAATQQLPDALAGAVRTPLDELIDATDTVAASLGLSIP